MSIKNIFTLPNGKKQFEVYQSIVCKFLLNLPLQQKKDLHRLSYHAQKAWYYYLDSVIQVKDDNDIPSQKRYQFFVKLKQYCPKSINLNPQIIQAKLKQMKPTCGAIIINQQDTKVLVIRNKYQQFGFPKGKWNQSEQPQQCAAREVYEQIGLYIHKRIDPTQKIQFTNKQNVPSIFYVVRGVKENQKTNIDKKQIEDVFWMNIADVNKYIKKFVSKSKTAWKQYLEDYNQPKLNIETFINYFKPKRQIISKSIQIVNNHNNQDELNPFLNFKFDKEKLMKVFAK